MTIFTIIIKKIRDLVFILEEEEEKENQLILDDYV